MNRPQKIRKIFNELKGVFKDQHGSSELLECAALILNYSEGKETGIHYVPRIGRTPFEELSLDVLFEKYSWKLVCREFQSDENYTPKEDPLRLINQISDQAA